MNGGQCGRTEHLRFGLFLETDLTLTHFGGVERSGGEGTMAKCCDQASLSTGSCLLVSFIRNAYYL